MRHTLRPAPLAATMSLAVLLSGPGRAEETRLELPLRWLGTYTRFDDDKRVDDFIALMERAKKAGYNGVRVTDGRCGRVTGRPASFYENLKRTGAAAKRIGIEVIPGIGHYMIMSDPNVAEALAARETPFLVKEGKAYPEEEDLLSGGDFDEPWERAAPGFTGLDKAGVCTFHDSQVKRTGRGSLRMENFEATRADRKGLHLVRAIQDFRMEPWTQYTFEIWVKTQDVSPVTGVHPTIAVKKDGRTLMYWHHRVSATGDWQVRRWVFNSLQYDGATLYLAARLAHGTVWFDDVRITRTGGINLVRRDGCPVRVVSDDGRTVYEEGRDFERWEDPELSNVPNRIGHWHPAPPIVLKKGSRIKEGQRLKVSFYHTVRIGKRNPGPCMRSELFFKHWEEMVRVMHEHLGAKRFHMMHNSELRISGQCALCKEEGMTTGQVVAENANRCLAIIRRIVPGGGASVSNDIFDPYHHAKGDWYALSGGSMRRAWEIDPSIIISLWYAKDARKPIEFFAGRGHRVVINTYYDYKGWDVALRKYLDVAREVEGVSGIMYTTFRGNYEDMERFSEIVDEYVQ